MGSSKHPGHDTASDLHKRGGFEALVLDFGRRVRPGTTIKPRRAC